MVKYFAFSALTLLKYADGAGNTVGADGARAPLRSTLASSP